MGKYDRFILETACDVNASSVEVSTVHVLVAIANELAELNELLCKRMQKPIPCEEENDLPECCLCGKQMFPNVKYQVFGFISNQKYAHIKCDHPPEKNVSPFAPWMWNEINGERVD